MTCAYCRRAQRASHHAAGGQFSRVNRTGSRRAAGRAAPTKNSPSSARASIRNRSKHNRITKLVGYC
eukprot:1225251-Pleurochrysis_carterae.AAC.1